MNEQTETKVEVKVGPYDEAGTFTGEIVRFTGEEVGSYCERTGQTGSRDDRGSTYTLYRCPGGYRVLVEHWSRWQGEGSRTHLLPNDAEDEPYLHELDDPGPITYGVLSEEYARSRFGWLFAAALDEPNVRELD